MVSWLVVWNMHGLFFHFVYGRILPIDELHHFSRWLLHHQPDNHVYLVAHPMNPKQLISVISPVTGCKKAGIGLSPLVPSGKLTVRYEKSPSLIGKSTTNVPK